MNQDIELTMFVSELQRLQKEYEGGSSERIKKELQKDIRLLTEVIDELKSRILETK
ncbi:hypothetical protein LRR81_08315 [Metabacillus sp. GX 13764]|uniref:hypothetical protein n=1 Tax=Metabacillus kandeliae TaxID=2900151 RepID=UPI001E3C8265|nr:hypothetical protein [Metabacillus kandeliae]MCD7034236.1 hypothetical protein [Metabacillus kandeliae]